jgi:hypothetical protein
MTMYFDCTTTRTSSDRKNVFEGNESFSFFKKNVLKLQSIKFIHTDYVLKLTDDA